MSQENVAVSSPEVHPSVVLLPSRQTPAARVYTLRVDVADSPDGQARPVRSWFPVAGGRVVSVVAEHGSFAGVEQVLRMTQQAAAAAGPGEVVLVGATIDDERSLLSWLRRFGVSDEEVASRYRVVHVSRPSDLAEAAWVLRHRGEKLAVVTLLDFGAIDVPDGSSRNGVMLRLSETLYRVAREEADKPLVLVETKGRRGQVTDQQPNPGLRAHSLLVQNSAFVFEAGTCVEPDAVRVIKARAALEPVVS